MADYPTFDSLLRSLSGRRKGDKGTACCPAHEDSTPSLSITIGEHDRPVFFCHAGCTQSAVIAALQKRGLWPDTSQPPPSKATNGNGANGHGPHFWRPVLPAPTDAVQPTAAMLQCDTLHEYHDADDRLLFYVRRHEAKTGRRKQFLPLTYGWLDSKLSWHQRAPDTPRPLFGLNRLSHAAADAPVLLCEGEKAADAAMRMFPDHVAMTWCGGASAVETADWRPLTGRSVIIWPDADDAGSKAAAQIAKRLPASRTLRTSDLPTGFDAADLEREADADPLAWLEQRLPPAPTPDPADDYEATPFTKASLADLRPYDWVFRRFMVARYFCALGAPPGTGKSALIIIMALSVVTGRALLGGEAPKQGNAWIINLEDPREAILKMIWACCQHYGIEPADLEGRLFVNSGRDKRLIVARLVDGVAVQMPVVPNLTRECAKREVRALFVDPVVDTHSLPENDNITMNDYCAIWNNLAEATNCAVLLSMHFRKGGVGGDPEAFRGASAIIGKARSAITLSVMAEKDAEKLGVKQEFRSYHLRLDNAKRNLSPPPTAAEWLRLESAELDIGDSIQVLRSWSPPSPWEGFSMAQAVRALDLIEAGPGDGEFYTATKRGRSNERWCGHVIVACAETTEMSEEQAGIIIDQWLQSGLLIKGVYHSPARYKEIACVRVDLTKLAEMRAASAAPPETPWDC